LNAGVISAPGLELSVIAGRLPPNFQRPTAPIPLRVERSEKLILTVLRVFANTGIDGAIDDPRAAVFLKAAKEGADRER
jgi:hypothetical protein